MNESVEYLELITTNWYDDEIVEKVAATRHLLHCHKVEFLHPKSGVLVSIVDKIDEKFLEFLNKEKIDLFSLWKVLYIILF